MLLKVECPLCHNEFTVRSEEVDRSRSAACPHCAKAIPYSGRFLSEVFWAFNNEMRFPAA